MVRAAEIEIIGLRQMADRYIQSARGNKLGTSLHCITKLFG